VLTLLMGKSERGEELLCPALPSTGFEVVWASDAKPIPCSFTLLLFAFP